MNYKLMVEDAQTATQMHMLSGVEFIDDQFGKGYAAKHPELLAAYVQACATELSSTALVKVIDKVGQRIADSEMLTNSVHEAAVRLAGAVESLS